MTAELLPVYRALLDVVASTQPLRGDAERLAYTERIANASTVRSAGLPRLALPRGAPDARRAELARKRRTQRRFAPGPVALPAISALLGYLADLPGQDGHRRLYPAAGSLFTIDTFLHVVPGKVGGLQGGLYQYDPACHQVVMLADLRPSPDGFGAANRPVLRHAAFVVLLVADLRRLVPLYGRHALQFATLEAGYLSQLLMQEAADCGLGLCPIGAQSFTAIRAAAGLDEAAVLVHSHAGGSPGPQASGSAPGQEPEET